MRPLDWLKNLTWIRAIRLYPTAKQNYACLLDAYINLVSKVKELTIQLEAKNAMRSVADILAPKEQERSQPYKTSHEGVRMSTLTWHEERLLRIELQAYKDKLAKASDQIDSLKDEVRHANRAD